MGQNIYWVVRGGCYHVEGCPALERVSAERKGLWVWANSLEEDFSPIVFGREALKNLSLKRPCLVCFPRLARKEPT